MRVIGLTGGIAMGKSTAAAAFRRAHIPVFDADACVRALQAPDGAALPAIAQEFPGTVRGGVLDRAALRTAVLADAGRLRVLEGILHPLVRAAQRRFLAAARRRGERLAVLDIPLLLEGTGRMPSSRRGRPRGIDLVLVVSAPAAVQRARLRRRGALSEAQAARIIALQLPDAEKRRRADVVIRTGLSRHHAVAALRRFILSASPADMA